MNQGENRRKTLLRYLFGLLLALAGLNHFLHPEGYVKIIPPYLPCHRFLVDASGVLEIIFGGLMLPRRTMRIGAWGAIVLLIGVFPANVQMAIHPEVSPEISPILLWLRLPLQPLMILWAAWYAGSGKDGSDRTSL